VAQRPDDQAADGRPGATSARERVDEDAQRQFRMLIAVVTVLAVAALAVLLGELHLTLRTMFQKFDPIDALLVIAAPALWSAALVPFQQHDGVRMRPRGPLAGVTPGWRANAVVLGVAALLGAGYGALVLCPVLLARTSDPRFLALLGPGEGQATLVANVGIVVLVYAAFVVLRLVLHALALRRTPVPFRVRHGVG